MTSVLPDDGAISRNAAVARTAVLICSPRAGRDAAVRAALAAAGVAVSEVVGVEALEPSAPLGREWSARGVGIAVAAGGDGTIGSVVTQIAGSNLALGILPLGTSNDTARSLGLPLDLGEAADVIANGVPVAVDAGRVFVATDEPEGARGATDGSVVRAGDGLYFLHALTLGVNAEFARLATDLVRRQRWGPLNYATSALEAVARFQPLEVMLALEGIARRSLHAARPDARGAVALEQRVSQIVAVNLPIFGGGLNLTLRETALHDQLLDVVVIEALSRERMHEVARSWREARRRARSFRRARNVTDEDGADSASLPVDIAGMPIPGVTRYQARAMAIRTPSAVDVTLDGDIRARTPVRVEAAPSAIRVLLPPATRPASALRADMVR
jgi:diacylglycerol kinase (ATP)